MQYEPLLCGVIVVNIKKIDKLLTAYQIHKDLYKKNKIDKKNYKILQDVIKKEIINAT